MESCGRVLLWGSAALVVLLLATAIGCSREPEVSKETPLTESIPSPTLTSVPLAASLQDRTVTLAPTPVPTHTNTPIPVPTHTPSPTVTPTLLPVATPTPQSNRHTNSGAHEHTFTYTNCDREANEGADYHRHADSGSASYPNTHHCADGYSDRRRHRRRPRRRQRGRRPLRRFRIEIEKRWQRSIMRRGGPNWKDDTNWLSDAPVGQWYGIRTDLYGRVVDIRMPDNGLTGHLPPELGYLDALRLIAIHRNRLSGEFPSEMANLSRLEAVDLCGSSLTGPLPGWLGGLGRLRDLSLCDNQLTGEIPETLGALSDLQLFDVRGNRLTGPIPPQLSELTKLRILILADNRLDGTVPAGLHELPNLTRLELQGNNLTGTAPKQTREGTATPTPTTAPNRDREALAAFYHATGGPGWKDDTNWLTDAPLGQWHGVRTGESGRVTKIALYDNGANRPSAAGNGRPGRVARVGSVPERVVRTISVRGWKPVPPGMD